ncbi:glutathione S-transferase family protein [Rhodovibrionaceae bacterium A322]
MSSPDMTLVIGNKNYSSWSLRAGLALALTGAEFDEVLVPLDEEGTAAALRQHSPSGLVPVLKSDGLVIWDSLAIGEHLAERFPDAGLWPADPKLRALARSMVCEMHAGFPNLRREMSMDMRKTYKVMPSMEVLREIGRLQDIWGQALDARKEAGLAGEFLFGAPGLIDCFYAPVVSRLVTYGLQLGPEGSAYIEAITGWDLYQAWLDAAKAEPWDLPDHGKPQA